MGFEPAVLSPLYARFKATKGEATFSIHLAPSLPLPSPTAVYVECEDLDAQVAVLEAKGLAFAQVPGDEAWLWCEAQLRDPSSDEICQRPAAKHGQDSPGGCARCRPA